MQEFEPAGRSVIIAAALVIVFAGVKVASGIVNPLLMAAFISIVCASPLIWMQRKGVPTLPALLLILAVILLLGMFTAGMLGSSLDAISEALPAYKQKLVELYATLSSHLDRWGLPLPFENIREALGPDSLMTIFNYTLSGISGLLANAMTVFLAVIFMLMEVAHLSDKLGSALKQPEESMIRLKEFNRKVVRYLALKAIVSTFTGLCVAAILWYLDIEFVFLWAFLAFFLNFIPYVGSLIAAIPPVTLALIDQGPLTALWVALGYLAVNMVVGNLLETRIVGNEMNLSALAVLISLLFWGWLLGPVGVFLSIPLTMLITIALESNPGTRRYAALLRNSP